VAAVLEDALVEVRRDTVGDPELDDPAAGAPGRFVIFLRMSPASRPAVDVGDPVAARMLRAAHLSALGSVSRCRRGDLPGPVGARQVRNP
jgi:hypothetical protein